MKDIYEILNDVDIEDDAIEVMNVSDIEKAKVKKYLRESINKNRVWKKRGIAAFLCCSLIGSTGALGVAYPSYAAEIPIVGDIFRFIDNGRTGAYDKYKEYAEVVGTTQESNGIKVTIKEAIFDGRTLTYTYEIISDKDLGDNPFFNMNGPRITIKNYNGGSGGNSGVKKVAQNTYVGQETVILNEERKAISFELNFTDIGDMSSENSEEIKGNWKFEINLKALDNVKQLINKTTEKDGVRLNMENISKTPVTFTLNYSQEVSKELQEKYFIVDIPIEEVRDDLGNVYKTTSISTNEGSEGRYAGKSISNFGKLNPNATKLIITPKVHLSNDVHKESGNAYGKGVDTSPIIDEDHPKNGEITLDDIVIELKSK
ncbi:DUF4179 domain-containing protein [Clostridium saccharobutylicum]|uniref:DUF4179 domain-containing protein n=1 Tax=Clostridium saccharobutylicum TaxID=169679 RepID=A0A1S8NDP0_CLOSA|nr:DUF4179 domain-containing protein [Clostridium saccharobutylicum]OOM14605.1 hypothetical protein CLOSAC_14850 [Clostridium saccharobutylicum]